MSQLQNPTFESPKNKAFDKCSRSSSLMPSQLNRAKPSFVRSLGVHKNHDINLKKTAYEVGTHSSDDAAKFGGSKKRGVVKEGVTKDTRNVMVEEAASINEDNDDLPVNFDSGGSKKMSAAKGGGFERTTVQQEESACQN
ncbi:hypothetical protein QYF36_009532 [Acer negundo]|nr:hypothetical protein QYF36_009532 [Acer negundo]